MKYPGNIVVTRFVDTFFAESFLSTQREEVLTGRALMDVLKKSYTKHPEIFTNETYNKGAIEIFYRLGVNELVTKEKVIDAMSRCFAVAIICLEGFFCFDGKEPDLSPDSLARMRDLNGGGDNEVIRFFAKRATCSCLKKLYATAKQPPRTGFCTNCNSIVKRSTLRLCGGCRLSQYCCKDCQIKHWGSHKEFCEAAKHVRKFTDRVGLDKHCRWFFLFSKSLIHKNM